MFVKSYFRLIKGVIQSVKKSVELHKYNNYTIAEYFRKQGVQIGDDCLIVPRNLGAEPYLVKIGNHVTIANGAKFITHDGGPWIFRNEIPDIQVFGPIIIKDNCVIGRDAILMPNIAIGPNSIVGAGSVVITDVPPDSIVMGVPARKFGSVDRYKQKCIERWGQQKPHGINISPGASINRSNNFENKREILKQHLLKVFKDDLGS